MIYTCTNLKISNNISLDVLQLPGWASKNAPVFDPEAPPTERLPQSGENVNWHSTQAKTKRTKMVGTKMLIEFMLIVCLFVWFDWFDWKLEWLLMLDLNFILAFIPILIGYLLQYNCPLDEYIYL